jgi:hypothetical protein
VNAFQYVGAPGKYSGGTLMIGGDGTAIVGSGTNFAGFKNQGLIKVGSRIQIPKDTGRWYTISGFPGGQAILISQPYADYYSTASGSMNFNRIYSGLSYVLELQPQPLADSTPVQLLRGAVIDLDGSKIPLTWRPTAYTGAYSNQMDILFSARGLPTGDVVSLGTLHLHVADATDVLKWQSTTTSNPAGVKGRNYDSYIFSLLPLVPADDPASTLPVVSRDHLLVSLSSRTGNVGVYPVNPTNGGDTSTATVDYQKIADDPFYFAETGGVAGK